MTEVTETRPTTTAGAGLVLGCVDLGKSSCRLRIVRGDGTGIPLFEATENGSPGLADTGGVETAFEAVERVLERIAPRTELTADRFVVGAAGAAASPDGAAELARRLRKRTGRPVAVGSDIVIAHAGAFRGEAGTVLIAGTGSVAYGLDRAGRFTQVDGWGPWLGDEGSGRWIGQAGLRASLRALDGRGPQTTLAEAVRSMIGDPLDVPGWVSRGLAPARTLGTFAVIVIDHAATGDPVADRIVTEAVDALALTAATASEDGARVAVTGGLSGNRLFRSRLDVALTDRGLAVAPSLGTPLDGAHLLAARTGLAYERKLFRAE